MNLSFNQAERLAAAKVGGAQIASYVYDAFEERFSKALTTGGSIFLHDQSGELLEETGLTGSLTTDTIYLNGVPVADITPSATFFLHADRFGTPQVATTTAKAVAWQADYQPFGTNTGGSGLFTQNLRFPGQYVDKETGFDQNEFRDYNPAFGRYLESDPVGLASGVDTYGYAFQNPEKYFDNTGLRIFYRGTTVTVGDKIGVTVSVGTVFDLSGNYATYITSGGGASSTGAGIALTAGTLDSTDESSPVSVDSFGGPFASASAGGVLPNGVYLGGEGFVDPTNPSHRGYGFNLGFATPGPSGSIFYTRTCLKDKGNIYDDISNSFINIRNDISNGFGNFLNNTIDVIAGYGQ